MEARANALLEARRVLKIGDGDARALLFIADNPGTRPTQLSEYLGITSAGVTALIDRLIDRGAVRRDVDSDDRRVNRITAIVDLEARPWSSLKQFDAHFDQSVAAGDPHDAHQLAAALELYTDSAIERVR
jgi:hypothetical protein